MPAPLDEDDDPARPMFDDDEDAAAIPPFPFAAADPFDAQSYVASLFRTPLFGLGAATAIESAPDLATAARTKLRSAGLIESDTPTPESSAGEFDPQADDDKPRSWKLPARWRGLPETIFGRNASAIAKWPTRIGEDIPHSKPTPRVPLEHPDARAGIALSAADTILSRGAAAVTQAHGNDREAIKRTLDAAIGWIGSLLPPEYRSSVAKSGEIAIADAGRRIDEQLRAAQNHAALLTLSERRAESEHAYQDAIHSGDAARIAAARRNALEAFRAERRARGDSHAEVNAGARLREAALRAASLRHRLAQLDDAGMERVAQEDEDARFDAAGTRRLIEEIKRIRRDDPARAGEASVERELEARRRRGLIAAAEDERRTRYALRLEAQAKRGIPMEQRRLLTNDEYTALAAEYHRREGRDGQAAAEAWLSTQFVPLGRLSEPLKDELDRARARVTKSRGQQRVVLVETADAHSDLAQRASDEADIARQRSLAKARIRAMARNPAQMDQLLADIVRSSEVARRGSIPLRDRTLALGKLFTRIDLATSGDPRLRHVMKHAARLAFSAAANSSANIEDAVLEALTGASLAKNAEIERAESAGRRQRERQRSADERLRSFIQSRPNSDYRERLAAISAIARETGAVPRAAMADLRPDLSTRGKTLSPFLADPEKVLAQLSALAAIVENDQAAESLPHSLRELAREFAIVLNDPRRPQDPEKLIHAAYRRGVPRRIAELEEHAEAALEVLTPWGTIVSLYDAWKSAQNAYDAIVAGEAEDGASHSADALAKIAMAAPIFASLRGVKRVSAGTKRSSDGTNNIAVRAREGARIQRAVADRLRADLEAHGITVTGVKQIHTRHGRTDIDNQLRTKHDQRWIGIEAKIATARFRRLQRKKQELLKSAYLIRRHPSTGEMKVYEIRRGKKSRDYDWDYGESMPYETWIKEVRRELLSQ